MKYQTSYDQNENLPNKRGLIGKVTIENAEQEGLLEASILLEEQLSTRTNFNLKYIQLIHLMAFGELYDFAGKWRNVNLSKAGFVFAAAQFLEQTMQNFEMEMLKNLPKKYHSKEEFLNDIARIHAELLFIHPFREGNGRTARLLADLMCRKYEFKPLRWEMISKDENQPLNFVLYIKAVQQAANQDYTLMQKIFRQISLF
jgi:cell filamentation protein